MPRGTTIDRPPAITGGALSTLLEALLENWFGDASDGDPGIPGPAFDRLANLDGARRDELLTGLRERCATAARQFVHPTWLEAIPARTTSSSQPPVVHESPWLEDWLDERRRTLIAFPTPLPWRLDERRPTTYFWALPPEEGLAVLGWHGLRPLARAARRLGHRPRRLGALAYALGKTERERLTAHVRELIQGDGDAESEDWLRELDRAEAEGCDTRDTGLRLALVELTARAAAIDDPSEAQAATEDLVRLAYRLPRRIGAPLFDELRRTRHQNSDLPPPATNEAALAADIEALAEAGRIPNPCLETLRREVAI